VFLHACRTVAKRSDSRYRSGRCREWIKIKNPAHPAIERAMLVAQSKQAAARVIPCPPMTSEDASYCSALPPLRYFP
jgi:hypothetical protein